MVAAPWHAIGDASSPLRLLFPGWPVFAKGIDSAGLQKLWTDQHRMWLHLSGQSNNRTLARFRAFHFPLAILVDRWSILSLCCAATRALLLGPGESRADKSAPGLPDQRGRDARCTRRAARRSTLFCHMEIFPAMEGPQARTAAFNPMYLH